MADIKGSERISIADDGVIDVVDEKEVVGLFKYLPFGPLWARDTDSLFYSFMLTLSYEFGRVRRRVFKLIDQTDPRTVDEMLPDFERVYGLPDECANPTDLAGRRLALQDKMNGFEDPNVTNIKARVLELLAPYNAPATVRAPIRRADLFNCQSDCNDYLNTSPSMFFWEVIARHTTNAIDAQIECEVEQVAPDHTNLNVLFGVIDSAYQKFTNTVGIAASTPVSSGAYSPELRRVVLSGSTKISISDDYGLTYTQYANTLNFQTMAWSPTLKLFVGFSGGTVYSSADGIQWVVGSSFTAGTWKVLWCNTAKRFIAARFFNLTNNVLWSIDGINWTAVSLAQPLTDIAYASELNRVIVVANAVQLLFSYSNDGGTTWSGFGAVGGTSPSTGWILTFKDTQGTSPGYFLAVDKNSNLAARSPDGLSWTAGTITSMTINNFASRRIKWIPMLQLFVLYENGAYPTVSYDGAAFTAMTSADSGMSPTDVIDLNDRASFIVTNSSQAPLATGYLP